MEVMVGKHWETEEKTLRTAVDSYYIICILCNIKNIYVIYIYNKSLYIHIYIYIYVIYVKYVYNICTIYRCVILQQRQQQQR